MSGCVHRLRLITSRLSVFRIIRTMMSQEIKIDAAAINEAGTRSEYPERYQTLKIGHAIQVCLAKLNAIPSVPPDAPIVQALVNCIINFYIAATGLMAFVPGVHAP